MLRIKSAVFLIVGFLFLSSNVWGATLTGVVKWQGKVPKAKKIKMEADPACMNKYKGKSPPMSQALVLGSGNTMGNIFVRVKSGLKPGKKHARPSEVVKITQKGCQYDPHVFGLVKGQKLQFLNEDGILHNVHALPKVNRQFNISMPKNMTISKVKKFKKSENMFRIKCDVHPWMLSYVGVVDHPYFFVTKADGKFEIKGLPAGTYEIEAWHEKAGVRTAKVTVTEGDSKSLDFTFSR